MQHLTLESLARLVDDRPAADEKAHLETCGACREELESLRNQTEALEALPEILPPPDAWPEVRRRLAEEGLIRPPVRSGRRWFASAPVRVAAALALFVAGGATGFLVRGPVEAGGAVAGDAVASAPASRDAALGDAAGPTGRSGRSGDDAEATFAAALDQFMEASGSATTTATGDPAARLAALDNIVLTTAEALNEAPGDPVINSYHLTAVAQRRALLRQLSTSRAEPVF